MNILPKKNWHVRTKENIARVRRDEAKAAEEAKEMDRRRRLAEQEARTSVLREKARSRMIESGSELVSLDTDNKDEPVNEVVPSAPQQGHINFFQQLEDGEVGDGKTNKQHEEEKKKEQEEYEKKVGYLTYLGQDTEELTGEQVWWKKLPINRKAETDENALKASVSQKQKDFLDPLGDLKKYLKCDGVRLTLQKYERKKEEIEHKAINFESVKKRKKRKRSRSSDSSSRSRSRSRDRRKKSKRHKSSSKKKRKHKSKHSKKKHSSSSDNESDSDSTRRQMKINLDKLRSERLERERLEREKANKLLYGEPDTKSKEEEKKSREQKYSSQFNPQIARQNKLDPKKKYWLE